MHVTPEPALAPPDRAMVVEIVGPVPDDGVHQLKTGLVADRLAKIEVKREEVRPPGQVHHLYHAWRAGSHHDLDPLEAFRESFDEVRIGSNAREAAVHLTVRSDGALIDRAFPFEDVPVRRTGQNHRDRPVFNQLGNVPGVAVMYLELRR